MSNPKVHNGKLNRNENTCPHCGSEEYSDYKISIMELSAQHYKICLKCKGHYVDTYLIDFGDDNERWHLWCESERPWELSDIDEVELFNDLDNKGNLIYDMDNPDTDKDYYDLIPNSIDFIKGDQE